MDTISRVLRGQPLREGYNIHQELLFFRGRVVLLPTSTWISRILHDFHDSVIGSHSRFLRTYKRVLAVFFSKGMKKSIKDYVSNCSTCQHAKTEALSLAGLLQPLPIPQQIWEDLSMDFIGGLPKFRGMDTIFVVVDRLSKYAHFCPLAHPYSATQVAALFIHDNAFTWFSPLHCK